MNAYRIAMLIVAAIVDIVFFVGSIYAAHANAFPKEACVGLCTALVIARGSQIRNAVVNGATADGVKVPSIPPPSGTALLLAMVAGAAAKAKGGL